MPLPDIIKPLYPNVPDVAGVPRLVRAVAGELNTLGGSIQGTLDSISGAFRGRIEGVLAQNNGLASPVNVIITGVTDTLGNIAGQLDGSIAGQIIGVITGDTTSGFFTGLISGTVDNLIGAPGSQNADSATVLQKAPPPKWGLYLNGTAVIVPDNIVAFGYNAEWQIANYPIEQGGFESYNKVRLPAEPRLTMSKGGTEAERAQFLDTVRAIVPKLDLYDIVTPQATFSNMNVKRWTYEQRADRGANLIVVEFMLEEIRTTATSLLSSNQTPPGLETLNSGPVQAVTPTTDQAAAASGGAS